MVAASSTSVYSKKKAYHSFGRDYTKPCRSRQLRCLRPFPPPSFNTFGSVTRGARGSRGSAEPKTLQSCRTIQHVRQLRANAAASAPSAPPAAWAYPCICDLSDCPTAPLARQLYCSSPSIVHFAIPCNSSSKLYPAFSLHKQKDLVELVMSPWAH